MHIGSKGWFVSELKKLGVTHYEERKLENYKTHILANLLYEKQK
ncbi:YflJ family protein [Salirhabdus salicampi]|nr:YflJ family protein [Salirhabdus salicampi]MCP8617902.1 YflJ family protein [Salirhabdus salicampi]